MVVDFDVGGVDGLSAEGTVGRPFDYVIEALLADAVVVAAYAVGKSSVPVELLCADGH